MVRVRREARRSGLVRGEKDAETKGLIACVHAALRLLTARSLTLYTLYSSRFQSARPARLADAP